MCHISSHAKPLESLCSYSMMPTCPWPQHLRLLCHRPFLWQLSRMEALGVVFRMDSVSALPSHFLPRDSAFSWEGNLCGGWRESGMVRNCSSQNHSKSVMVRVFTFSSLPLSTVTMTGTKAISVYSLLDTSFLPSD